MLQSVARSSPLFSQRRAGVLLHLTSLPGRHAWGCLGQDARYFVDFLAAAGLTVWQMLPVGPTPDDLSPYQSSSAHAGNPDLIDLEDLVARGWVSGERITGSAKTRAEHGVALHRAYEGFCDHLQDEAGTETKTRFHAFIAAQSAWLDDYALFEALRERHNKAAWNRWPMALRRRDAAALTQTRAELAPAIGFHHFVQFAFAEQWQALRHYAKTRGVSLFGDMPIFVAHDSADVWAAQHLFRLDDQGNALTVAGVPPDFFSETGQHWGNPHYDWERMETDGFQWWLARLNTLLQRFDLLRVDHFRGFEAYWEIPATEADARLGKWVKAPGKALLDICFNHFKTLPLVAENLGIITPEVEALRAEFGLPGMLVMQFAFDGSASNPYLPHNHHWMEVVYTGTHDNDTTLGWFAALNDATRAHIADYFGHPTEPMPWQLIEAALASVARLAIVPMQDLLGLDGRHRMNVPGTVGENWHWRFQWPQMPHDLASRCRCLLQRYGRVV